MKIYLLFFFFWAINLTVNCQTYINPNPIRNSDEKWGFVDMTGKNVIIPFEYDYAELFIGKATVVKKQSKFYLIDFQGKILFENSDTIYLAGKDENFWFAFKTNNLFGIVDDTGQVLQEPKYNNISYGNLIKLNDRWGTWESGIEDFNNIVYIARPDEAAIFSKTCLEYENKEVRRVCDNYYIMSAINERLVYPDEARKNNIEGTVVIEIIIDENGNVKGTQIIRDIGGGCGAVVKYIIDLLNKDVNYKWARPGYHEGTPVSSVFNLPVKFKLE